MSRHRLNPWWRRITGWRRAVLVVALLLGIFGAALLVLIVRGGVFS